MGIGFHQLPRRKRLPPPAAKRRLEGRRPEGAERGLSCKQPGCNRGPSQSPVCALDDEAAPGSFYDDSSPLSLMHKKRPIRMDGSFLVRERRLELPRRLTHAPQTCLSTCSSTLAYSLCLVQGKGYYSRFSSFVKAVFSEFSSFSFSAFSGSPAVSKRSCAAARISTPIRARAP